MSWLWIQFSWPCFWASEHILEGVLEPIIPSEWLFVHRFQPYIEGWMRAQDEHPFRLQEVSLGAFHPQKIPMGELVSLPLHWHQIERLPPAELALTPSSSMGPLTWTLIRCWHGWSCSWSSRKIRGLNPDLCLRASRTNQSKGMLLSMPIQKRCNWSKTHPLTQRRHAAAISFEHKQIYWEPFCSFVAGKELDTLALTNLSNKQ